MAMWVWLKQEKEPRPCEGLSKSSGATLFPWTSTKPHLPKANRALDPLVVQSWFNCLLLLRELGRKGANFSLEIHKGSGGAARQSHGKSPGRVLKCSSLTFEPLRALQIEDVSTFWTKSNCPSWVQKFYWRTQIQLLLMTRDGA